MGLACIPVKFAGFTNRLLMASFVLLHCVTTVMQQYNRQQRQNRREIAGVPALHSAERVAQLCAAEFRRQSQPRAVPVQTLDRHAAATAA